MSNNRIQFLYEDTGYCRLVYKDQVNGNLFCFQEETSNFWIYYYCTPDEEPIGPANPPKYVVEDFYKRMDHKDEVQKISAT